MAIETAYNIHQKYKELATGTHTAAGQMFQCLLRCAFLSFKMEFLIQVAMSRNPLLVEVGGQASHQHIEVIHFCVSGASFSALWQFPH